MKTTALLCLQYWQIDDLLAALLDERNGKLRVARVVELVEKIAAHLAVKKNVLYPAIDDTLASALVASWLDNTAALHALHALATAASDAAACAARARALRETLETSARLDESLAVALEASLPPAVSELLGSEAERFHAACMYARLLSKGHVASATAPRRAASRDREAALRRDQQTLHDASATGYRFAGDASRRTRTERSSP